MDPRPPVPVARLAVEIADEAARSDIESFCVRQADGWYSTAPHAGLRACENAWIPTTPFGGAFSEGRRPSRRWLFPCKRVA